VSQSFPSLWIFHSLYSNSHQILTFFSVDDVYAMSEKLEKAGCSFKKKPDEGRSEIDVIIF
jgi:hypothetical protein